MFANFLNWIKDTLQSWGWNNKKGKIIFLGLDDAGKSTLLFRLKEDRMAQLSPTTMPHAEQLMVGSVRVTAWDLGGHQAARKTWKNYFPEVDGIIFIVDSSRPSRFQESKIQLEGILDQKSLQNVPIVILGNKIDKKGAVSVQQMTSALDIKVLQQKERPINVFMCSVANKIGYGEAFKWLGQYLK